MLAGEQLFQSFRELDMIVLDTHARHSRPSSCKINPAKSSWNHSAAFIANLIERIQPEPPPLHFRIACESPVVC
jgi:hypothetical protein